MAKNNYTNGTLFSKKPLTISETGLSGMIAEYLDRRRIYNDRLNSGMIRSGHHFIHLCKTGTPDRFCIVRGRIIFIEVKVFGKKASVDQLARHRELAAAEAVVIVADSFESFERQFNLILDELKSERQKCQCALI